jgi:acyl dehydratase
MPTVFNTPAELKTAVGRHLGRSDWLEVTQERINQFADATGDHQWIHVDPELAKSGPFGACIAHGYLTLSLVNYFLPQIIVVQGIRMGELRRDRCASRAGARRRPHRGAGELVGTERTKDGGVQATMRVTVEIEGSDRPACVADVISRSIRWSESGGQRGAFVRWGQGGAAAPHSKALRAVFWATHYHSSKGSNSSATCTRSILKQ